MVRGRGRPKILSISERENLSEEKRDLEGELKDAESFGRGTRADVIDKSEIKRKISYMDGQLHRGLPPKVKGLPKDQLIRRSNELREEIIKGMPTRFEMDNPAKCPGAVHKHLKWEDRTQKQRDEYREIMRTVEPDDPTATDLEKYRKTGGRND